jgi:hypothetical protein
MEQRTAIRRLTFKGFKTKKIEMELIIVYGDEALAISAGKKWQTHLRQGKTKPGDERRSRRQINSDLTQVIVEFIRERSFLSCKI